MQVFHTSPGKIEKIHNNGLFDDGLFFSSKIYQMAHGEVLVYSLEIDEDEIIEARRFFYHESASKLDALVTHIAERFAVDTDTAEALLSEQKCISDIYRAKMEAGENFEEVFSAEYDLQTYALSAAKLFGYRGVQLTDEQGTSYLISMSGRENELQVIEKEN